MSDMQESKIMQNLYYIHDPMCSWCWAFRPVWQQIKQALPKDIHVHSLLGGLAPDSDQVMPDDTREFIMQTWHKIIQNVPETEFNFDFWEKCIPRRSTYPACRAVIVAESQGTNFEEKMIRAIQIAYYQQARNPSDTQTLCELAGEIGLDVEHFSKALDDEKTQTTLLQQVQFARDIGANSFPSLFLQVGNNYQSLQLSYTNADYVLQQITKSGWL